MEFEPYMQKLPELAIVAVAHLGILAHRYYRRNNLNKLSPRYHRISLYLEHIISHATRPLFFSYFTGWDLQKLPDLVMSTSFSAATGVVYDGVIPLLEEGKPQYKQMASNIVGEITFLASMLVKNSL